MARRSATSRVTGSNNLDYARIAARSGTTPRIAIMRFRLYASTCKLISVLTFCHVFVRKCVAPIHALRVPNGCSTV
jgi:hypothetical protein